MYKIFNWLFELIIFSNCILRVFPKFTYFDEVLFLTFCLLCMLKLMKFNTGKFKINKRKIIIFISSGILFLGGIILALKSGIQPNKIAILKVGFNYIKIFLVFLVVDYISENINKDNLLNKVAKRASVYIKVMFIFMIFNIFINNTLFNLGEYRYGIREYKFLFSHPTYMVASLCMILSIIRASNLKRKKSLIYMTLILILSSLKSKAFLFVIFYILIELFLQYRNRIKLWHIIISLNIVSFAIYDKAIYYLRYGYTAARSALILIGFDLAIKYFPFGIGFGAFSGKYYTSLYSLYNVNNILGLSRENYSYAGDMFWPVLLGEVGVLGLILYIISLSLIFLIIISRYSISKDKYLAAIFLIGYLMIASFVESILGDAPGMMSFIVLTVYLGNSKILTLDKLQYQVQH